MEPRERWMLALTAVLGVLSLALLWRVLPTIFFASTVAVVLFPVRAALVDRGVDRRLAAAACTTLAFLAAVALALPVAWTLYRRREALIATFRSLPARIPVELAGLSTSLDVAGATTTLRAWLTEFAIQLAGETPIIALKAVVFALVVYAVLARPNAVRDAAVETVPSGYLDVLEAMYERLYHTLVGIYVIQAAVAVVTFVAAAVVFWALGFDAPIGLAVLSGVLQFIPVVGPSLLVAVLAGGQLLVGDASGAAVTAALGLVVVAFLPDVVVRPRLAPTTADLPASVYFAGFTGGVLTVGAVGFVAGPLVVALALEATHLLVAERAAEA